MAQHRKYADEIDALKQDIASLRQKSDEGHRLHLVSALASEIGDMRELIEKMLKDAEADVAEHPIATVAGALVLGILIGRITAR